MRTLFTFKFEEIFSFISNKNQGYKQKKLKKMLKISHFYKYQFFFEKILLFFLIFFNKKENRQKAIFLCFSI